MRSYILQLRARDETILPASNGYLLFSLICALARGSALDSVLHPDAQEGEKVVSIGMVRPQGQSAFGTEDLHFVRGATARARVSFIRDTDGDRFESLLRPRQGTTVRLGTSLFILESLLVPGEDELALSLSSTQLIPSTPPDSVGLHFVSPAGFKRDGRQFFLPFPELIFGGLLRRWRFFFGTEEWTGFEESLPHIELLNYRVESRAVRLKQDRILRGFCGEAEFAVPGKIDSKTTLSALAGLAFFTGVGYKTAQGMGEVWPFWRR